MVSQDLLKEFFEDQFKNSSNIFLYKDKKFLSEGRYRDFAEEQIKKANKIFLGASFMLFIMPLYAMWYLVESGMESSYVKFAMGVFFFMAFCLSFWKVCKEYFTIKSSMQLLIRILDKSDHLVS